MTVSRWLTCSATTTSTTRPTARAIATAPTTTTATIAAYISSLAPDRLANHALPWCPAGTPRETVEGMAPALRGADTLAEVGDLVASVLESPEPRPLPALAELRA